MSQRNNSNSTKKPAATDQLEATQSSSGLQKSGQIMLFAAVTLLYWVAMYIYVPTLTPYLSSRGVSLDMIGIILGSYGFVQLLLRFPLGILSDKWGKRKPFVVAGMFCAAISCALFLLPGLWVWPLAGRIVAGICASAWVAFTIMFAGYFPSNQTAKAMGYISVLIIAGQLIGMLLSGWLVSSFSELMPYIVGIVISLVGFALALLLREPEQASGLRQGMSFARIASVIRTRTLIQVSLLSILAHGVLFVTMFGFTPLRATELGADASGLMWIVLAFMLLNALASFLTHSHIVPRIGAWRTITVAFVVSGICTALMIFIPNMPMLLVTQALNGFAQGLHLPLFLGLAIRDVQMADRATAMGLYQAIYSIGMFSGPFLAGWISARWGLGGGFAFGGLLALLALMLVCYYTLTERKRA